MFLLKIQLGFLNPFLVKFNQHSYFPFSALWIFPLDPFQLEKYFLSSIKFNRCKYLLVTHLHFIIKPSIQLVTPESFTRFAQSPLGKIRWAV